MIGYIHMTQRLIGTLNYTMNYNTVNQQLRDEMVRATCCMFPGKGSAAARKLLDLLEGVEATTLEAEASVKTSTERVLNIMDLLYDPLSRLARAHLLRVAGDAKGCWRLLELVDPIVFGDLAAHAESIQTSIEWVEKLENVVQKARLEIEFPSHGMDGNALQKCTERTRAYAVDNFDRKAIMTTLLTQRLIAVKIGVLVLSKHLNELRVMTKADMAHYASELQLLDKIDGLRRKIKEIGARKATVYKPGPKPGDDGPAVTGF